MEYQSLIKRIKEPSQDVDEEYLKKLVEDIRVFLDEDHPDEQKREFAPLGYLGHIQMLLTGMEYRKNGGFEKK